MNQGYCIWSDAESGVKDVYRIFRKRFTCAALPEAARLEIAADSSYAVYVNGVRLPVQQTADLPGDKTFSTAALDGLLREGENVVAVEVHFVGEDFLTVQAGVPYLMVRIFGDGKLVCATNNTWKCADNPAYFPEKAGKTSPLLGFAFMYDSRRAMNWRAVDFDDSAWRSAIAVEAASGWKMSPRHVPQLLELPEPEVRMVQAGVLRRESEAASLGATCIGDWLAPLRYDEIFEEDSLPWDKTGLMFPDIKIAADGEAALKFRPLSRRPSANGFYVIADLGRETVGFVHLKLDAPAGTVVDIAFGEHLDDGRVRCCIGGSSYVDRYICHSGVNDFIYVHRRLGARYIELHITGLAADAAPVLHYIGVVPLQIPLPPESKFESCDRLLAHTRRVAVDTLKLCMHEHYEDCPWREQGLYAYDSRNQMLYGYYVWGNYDYAAASLDLLGKSYDGERYLALTSPGRIKVTIPAFTMVWITALYEHHLFSGDASLTCRWLGQIDAIIDRALAEADPDRPGLYHPGSGKKIWNFCEWNGDLSGRGAYLAAPYNLYLYEALRSAARLHGFSGNHERSVELDKRASALAAELDKRLWRDDLKLYGASDDASEKIFFEHIQTVMLADGLVPEARVDALLEAISSGTLCQIDLSALRYLVKALLNCGGRARRLLNDYLQRIFDPIVLGGATSLWETRHGSEDFYRAGSLCHAWSSVMPYYCGRGLLGVRPLEPGFRRFEVKPCRGGLTAASGEVPTSHGNILVEWHDVPGGIALSVGHPAGTEPEIASYEETPVVSVKKYLIG
ncbi:MAG: family 78 glycoside hydrolase catalytic domain [Victivallaceae bacterium]|nr:family 78 glycoside hydrolase catalytic domain [Victivallaceae bacterium]